MSDEDRQEVAAVRTWYDRTAEAFDERYAGTSGEFWESFEEQWRWYRSGAGCNIKLTHYQASLKSEKPLNVQRLFIKIIPAASYFPTQLPAQYHWRCGA